MHRDIYIKALKNDILRRVYKYIEYRVNNFDTLKGSIEFKDKIIKKLKRGHPPNTSFNKSLQERFCSPKYSSI